MSKKMTFTEIIEYLKTLSSSNNDSLPSIYNSNLNSELQSLYAAEIISNSFEDLRQTQFPFLAYTTVTLEHDAANRQTRIIFKHLHNNSTHIVQQVVQDSILVSIKDLEGFIRHLIYDMSLQLSYYVYKEVHRINQPLVI